MIHEENMNMKMCSLFDIGQIGKHYVIKSTAHPKSSADSNSAGTYDPTKSGIKR